MNAAGSERDVGAADNLQRTYMTQYPENYARFWAAADELAAANVRPTLRGVLEKAGGSMRDVTRAVDLWRQRAVPLSEVTAPAPDALIASAREMWRDACERAGALVNEERKALAAAAVNVQAQIEEVTEVAALYESQRDDLALRLDQITTERDSALKRVRSLEAKADSLEQMCGKQMEAIATLGSAKKVR